MFKHKTPNIIKRKEYKSLLIMNKTKTAIIIEKDIEN